MSICKILMKVAEGIIAHLILFLVPIATFFVINNSYTNLVPDYKNDHLFYESIAYFVWFMISVSFNFAITWWISKRVFETKKSSEFYKLILTLSYLFILTLVSFLALDKLINEEHLKIIVFLLTISFGSLVPVATFNFRNHKEFKNPIPVEDENFYERTTQLKERKTKNHYIMYDEFFFYKNDKDKGQICYSNEKTESYNIQIEDSKNLK